MKDDPVRVHDEQSKYPFWTAVQQYFIIITNSSFSQWGAMGFPSFLLLFKHRMYCKTTELIKYFHKTKRKEGTIYPTLSGVRIWTGNSGGLSFLARTHLFWKEITVFNACLHVLFTLIDDY